MMPMVEALARAGVRTVFGVPGAEGSLPIEALRGHASIRVVPVNEERQAVFAAAGYAFTTGELAVVFTSSNAAAMRALRQLECSRMERLPILIIAGEGSRASFGTEVFGSSCANLSVRIRTAVAVATSGNKGAFILDLPSRLPRAA